VDNFDSKLSCNSSSSSSTSTSTSCGGGDEAHDASFGHIVQSEVHSA
jgi:hypothetical protein